MRLRGFFNGDLSALPWKPGTTTMVHGVTTMAQYRVKSGKNQTYQYTDIWSHILKWAGNRHNNGKKQEEASFIC